MATSRRSRGVRHEARTKRERAREESEIDFGIVCNMCMCMHMCMRTRMHMCMHTFELVSYHAYVHKYIHVHAQICIYK